MQKRLNLSFAFVFSALPIGQVSFQISVCCQLSSRCINFVKSAKYLHVFGRGRTSSVGRPLYFRTGAHWFDFRSRTNTQGLQVTESN